MNNLIRQDFKTFYIISKQETLNGKFLGEIKIEEFGFHVSKPQQIEGDLIRTAPHCASFIKLTIIKRSGSKIM